MITFVTPLLAGLATVAVVFVLAVGVAGVRSLVRRVSIRRGWRRSKRLRESGVTSQEWVYRVRAAQDGPARAPTVVAPTPLTSEGDPSREVRAQPPASESRPKDDGLDAEAALEEAEHKASEILTAAERSAVELEESVRRSAEATLEEAQHKASEILAAAERRAAEVTEAAELEESDRRSAEAAQLEEAAELEKSVRRSAEAALKEAEHKASEILTAAERNAAGLEESARGSAEAVLAAAQQKASELVANAERERIRLQNDLAREQSLVEETRKKLSALLESVLADVKDESTQVAPNVSDLREARDSRGWSAGAEQ